MACNTCIETLQGAGHVLYELDGMERDVLPPPPFNLPSWAAVAETLVRLAGHLRSVNAGVATTYGESGSRED